MTTKKSESYRVLRGLNYPKDPERPQAGEVRVEIDHVFTELPPQLAGQVDELVESGVLERVKKSDKKEGD